MAEIKMSLQEYNDLINQRDEAQRQCAAMKEHVHEVETTDPTERIPGLLRCIESALPVVKFAVGNLDPHTVRNWPYTELAVLADELEKAPSVDVAMKAVAHEFRSFIRDAREIEAERLRRDAVKAAPVEIVACVSCAATLPRIQTGCCPNCNAEPVCVQCISSKKCCTPT